MTSGPRLDRRQLLRVGGAGVLGALAPGAAAESDPEPLWSFATVDAVRTSPTVVDGTVYVGVGEPDQDSAIRALDAETGEARWRVDVDGSDPLSPTVVDGLLVGGSQTELVALTAADGEAVWRREQPVASTPAMAGGRVVFGTGAETQNPLPGRGGVEARRAGSGQRRWRFEPGDVDRFSTPVVVDETAYVGGSDGALYALDVATGDRVWRVEEGVASTPTVADEVVGAPTVADGVVYAVTDESRLVALEAATGDRLWETLVGAELVAPPTVADGTVLVTDSEGHLSALDAESGDAEWTAAVGDGQGGFGGGFVQSAPTVADGVVCAATGFTGTFEGQGELAAFEAATGEEVWRVTLGTAPLGSSPTIVDGVVYIGDFDGRVYAFDAPVEDSSGGSRVLLGTLGHHGAWADQAPTARFTPRPAEPAAGESVTLDAALTSGDVETYGWDIAGETATGRTVERSFQTPGGREVTLTATDTGGETRTATARVGVRPPRSWETAPDHEFTGAPTVVDGVVYAGGSDGLVAADAATGELLWTREESQTDSAPTVVDGTLYGGLVGPGLVPFDLDIDEGGQVYALDAETGTEQWRVSVDSLNTQPTVADGTVYVGTSDGNPFFGDGDVDGGIHALTPDGDRRWQLDVAGGVTARPVVVGDSLYVGSHSAGGGRVHAVETGTGTERWSVELDAAVESSPTVADGVVYVTSGATTGGGFVGQPNAGGLVALDSDTGERLWTVSLDGIVTAPTVADGTVVLGRHRVDVPGQVLAFDADGTVVLGRHRVDVPGQVLAFDATTGERLWQTTLDGTAGTNGPGTASLELPIPSPTVAGGVVYVGDGNGRLHALDVSTGNPEWRVDAGTGATVVDGTLYAGGSDGLAALDVPGAATSEDSAVLLGTRGHEDSWADQTPTALFDREPPAPTVDTPVTLDATATTGDIERYEWDLTGDDSVDATGPTVTRTFETVGTRAVTLTATSVDGETTTTTRPVPVGPPVRREFDPGVETDHPVVSSPTVVDGRVFVGGESVRALDAATGEESWVVETDNPVVSSPTVVDGVVFVGTGESVRALDAETGEHYWQATLDNEVRSSPTVADGTLYVGTAGRSVYALAAASGGELWRSAVDRDPVLSAPTVVDGTVFVVTPFFIAALDPVDGSTVWTAETGGVEGSSPPPITSSPTVVDGVVYAGALDGSLHALDVATGEDLWTAETDGPIRSSPTVADGTVFVGSADRTVRAFDAATGEESWSVETRGPVDASPTVAGGRVYVAADGRLRALDAATGSEAWQFRLGVDSGRVLSSPIVVDGTVYAVGSDGRVYALDPPVEASSTDSRVRLGTLGHRGDWRHAGQSLDVADTNNPGGPDEQNGDDDESDGFGPGFGPGGALAGLAGAGYLLRRRLGSTDDQDD